LATKVYFLLPYAAKIAPSQRFRVEAYWELLRSSGIQYSVDYFWEARGNDTLYQKGNVGKKIFNLGRSLVKRFFQVLTKAGKADYIFIHREAAPVGPPLFEYIIARIYRKKIIFDFDDAIWIPNTSENNRVASAFKAFWKVKYICKWSYKVSAGNHYLGRWASNYNSSVVFNPTCVDMNRYNILEEQEDGKITIGWTGSHSTLKYLDLVKPLLEELEKQYDFRFLVICDKAPAWKIRSLQFIPWNESTEIQDLRKIHIGIMPLEQDEWSEGKCGFKIIQYLALGIPAVASPIGVNKEIIIHGKNGYLCNSINDWKLSLIELMNNHSLRKEMGKAGNEKISGQYSIQANAGNFLSLFS
jgi:glycosyltransferase involved in cell wall biosynthesis